ncbi:hypothetical protein [Pontibacter sp. G13]|uniref:hypothetical protein n=1 Tax=Pontibacter sp. G13 TaxID=3074898 RepID=UPI002889A831|nr:hypothetical protein [Pontibacter sp. G13]WNJ19215.1 hypothetical protein RJD25_01880 [Pontibacter sp. G13]
MHTSSKPYQAISCNIYDELEIRAMRRKSVDILFEDHDGKEQHLTQVKIADLQAVQGVEYLLTDTDVKIRLDQLRIVDGIMVSGSCEIDPQK